MGALFVIVGLAIVGTIITVAAVGLMSALRRKPGEQALPDPEELGAEGRRLVRPLKQDRDEIEKIIQQHRDKAHIQAVGKEVLSDVDGLILQASRLAVKANSLKKLTKGQSKAEMAIGDLEIRLAASTSDAERRAYEDALEAKRSEISNYGEAQSAKGRVEAAIMQAHARVSEIKSKLIASAVRTSIDSDATDDLREMVDRLQSLRASLDETETLFQDT